MAKPKFKAEQVVAFTDYAPARPLRIKKVLKLGIGYYCTFYDAPDIKHEVPEESLRRLYVRELR
jgi:hypothetical protein